MRIWLAIAAALALGCSEDLPETAPADDSEGISFEVAPPPVGEQSQLFAEGVPLAEAVSPVPETPPAATPPPPAKPKRSSRDAAAANASPEKAAEAHVPLESLLKTPGAANAPPPPRPVDLTPPEPPTADGKKNGTPGALERWKDRVRVQRSQEAIGRSGPRQGTVSHTEAGVRVPVDDAVSLEGGVRVDSRDEPGAEQDERSSIPRVGVEVKF
jgi:hypothetical protein